MYQHESVKLPLAFLEEVHKLWSRVDKEVYEGVFDFHVVPAARNAEKLAKLKSANIELVVVAAYLHDIGYIGKGHMNHEIRSAKLARKILQKHGYSQQFISRVEKCIVRHSTSQKCEQWTIEDEILRNADAMAHFQCLPYIIAFSVKEGRTLREAISWLSTKLHNDWQLKLTMPEARTLVEPCYKAAQELFRSMHRYL